MKQIVNISFLIIIISFLSCNLKKKGNSQPFLKIDLPYEANLNEELKGNLIYSSPFDKIPINSEERRYIYLYLAVVDKPTHEYKKFYQKVTDTFIRIGDRIIPIDGIKFKKKGKQYINGFIIDQLYKEDPNDKSKFRISTIETKVISPIKVKASL